LDVVVILLGTNDLKKWFRLSVGDIAQGAGVLVSLVQGSLTGRKGKAPLVLLLAPPPTTTLTDYAEIFEEAENKSHEFAMHYGRVAQELGCAYMDSGAIIVSSPIDGIHFEAGEHRKLGKAVAVKVKELIG
jgi:lysophospholipase L1-like esterase